MGDFKKHPVVSSAISLTGVPFPCNLREEVKVIYDWVRLKLHHSNEEQNLHTPVFPTDNKVPVYF